jgi:hypothetical protein
LVRDVRTQLRGSPQKALHPHLVHSPAGKRQVVLPTLLHPMERQEPSSDPQKGKRSRCDTEASPCYFCQTDLCWGGGSLMINLNKERARRNPASRLRCRRSLNKILNFEGKERIKRAWSIPTLACLLAISQQPPASLSRRGNCRSRVLFSERRSYMLPRQARFTDFSGRYWESCKPLAWEFCSE